MKRFLLLFLALPVFADVPVPPAATQAQVNAGTATFPYVSPATLAGATSLPAPAGVVTNGYGFTNGALVSAYQITGSPIIWENLIVTLANSSNGITWYTNTATNGLTVYLVNNDPPWVADTGGVAWSISTNFPDTLTSGYVNFASGFPFPYAIGSGIWTDFNGDPVPIQVYQWAPALNNYAINAQQAELANLVVSQQVTAASIIVPGNDLVSSAIEIGQIGPPLLDFVAHPLPSGPFGFVNGLSIYMGQNFGLDHVIGWQCKMYTNYSGTVRGFFQQTVDAEQNADPLATYYFDVTLNAYGQTAFGMSQATGSNPEITPYLYMPAILNVFNPSIGRTNSAGLWLQPAKASPNPKAGILENDGTNFWVAVTNTATGQLVVNPLLSGFNGSGLTNLQSSPYGGFMVLSNAFNLNLITNGMPNFSSMICSSNGPIVVVTRSNNIGYVNYLNTPESLIP